jgi:hypothetical protein
VIPESLVTFAANASLRAVVLVDCPRDRRERLVNENGIMVCQFSQILKGIPATVAENPVLEKLQISRGIPLKSTQRSDSQSRSAPATTVVASATLTVAATAVVSRDLLEV